jgi:hypothetical protein
MTGDDFILTFDTDWAPDYMLESIAGALFRSNIKATWFITHDSPAVRRLSENPLAEVGLHPNYLPGSSHGDTTEEVLETLLAIAPDAVSVRSHAMVQSSALLSYYAQHTKLKIDSTIFLPEMAHIVPLRHALPAGELLRVPFFWADDYEMCKAEPQWNLERYINTLGLKVMLFHPVHIFLNAPDSTFYSNTRATYAAVSSLPEETAVELRHRGKGAADLFVALVRHLEITASLKLRDVLAGAE